MPRMVQIDTEGGGAHLVDIIAFNTLKGIIKEARETVEVEEGKGKGKVTIPQEFQDGLILRCEKVLLNYGESEAQRVVLKEIRAYLKDVRAFKERDDERKVRERLPHDTRRP